MMNESKLYPLELKICSDIGNGNVLSSKDRNLLLDSKDAIKVNLNINNTGYSKGDIVQSLNELFQSILQYYE